MAAVTCWLCMHCGKVNPAASNKKRNLPENRRSITLLLIEIDYTLGTSRCPSFRVCDMEVKIPEFRLHTPCRHPDGRRHPSFWPPCCSTLCSTLCCLCASKMV